jgi:putative CRISPR-associated protein (TIGR02619 family)
VRSEFHVVSVGNSLIRHYVEPIEASSRPGMRDEAFWARLLENPAELDRIFDFLAEDPTGRSAEVRSLEFYLRAHGLSPSDLVLYLVGTRTASNEVVRTALTRYFQTQGYEIYTPQDVPGYFGSRPSANDESPVEAFRQGMVDLLRHLVDVVSRVRPQYRSVVLNPTGGFKAHVIVVALAAFMTGCPVYYIYEEFEDLIEFPPLFYLPTVDELNFLQQHGVTGFVPEAVPNEGWLRRWIDFGVVAWDPDGCLRVTSRAQAFFSLKSQPSRGAPP